MYLFVSYICIYPFDVRKSFDSLLLHLLASILKYNSFDQDEMVRCPRQCH